MKNPNYHGGPVTGYFVLDKETGRLQNAQIQSVPQPQTLIDMMGECLYYGVTESSLGSRLLQCKFPDLDCVPEWNKDRVDTYYPDYLRPVLETKGIEPVEIHSEEMLYCMLNDVPLRVGEPEGVWCREDYAAQCETFPDRLPEIAGKVLRVELPDGQEAHIGLNSPALPEELLRPKSVPAIPVESHRHGVK